MSEETETKAKEPGPGEGGHYSPPTKDSISRQPQVDLKPEDVGNLPGAKEKGPASDEAVDYSDFTVAELKDMAHKRGVSVHADMLKDDIIKALEKDDAAS